MTLAEPKPASPRGPAAGVRRTVRRRTSLFAHGEPMVWLTGGTLVLAVAMILGLLGTVLWFGVGTFWPADAVLLETVDGRRLLGEVVETEAYEPAPSALASLPEEAAEAARRRLAETGGVAVRRELRTGNFELTGSHFEWIGDFAVAAETRPEWALVVERLTWGRFYGFPRALTVDGEPVATEPEAIWERLGPLHEAARERHERRRAIEEDEVGAVMRAREEARLRVREAELEHGRGSAEHAAAEERFEAVRRRTDEAFTALRDRIRALDEENERYQLVLETASGDEASLELAEIVRAYPPNRLGLLGELRVYLSRWWEYLTAAPREANTEGGVLPAIFGTVAMTMIMTVVVVPFGVLAALYLREYAKQGTIVSIVRIAVNNLAGVPSIVFGVFGLGFFCYIVGDAIDETFYEARLPDPTFGTGGLLWASLTLALLTLPVVIVATEEALSAVPNSMREGSYACGATKWQTIRRIVLPRAAPGIMTGTILAIARGAGEVAPLMLVGVVKLAPSLPVDDVFPYVHLQRSFMHLGFHIYDVGFQSQNSEAAKPMVFTTTLLLIAIVVLLNLLAIAIRTRLRRRFHGAAI